MLLTILVVTGPLVTYLINAFSLESIEEEETHPEPGKTGVV
jgi:hypothetical protein